MLASLFPILLLAASQAPRAQARPKYGAPEGFPQQIFTDTLHPQGDIANYTTRPRPFYAIAHRVLMVQSIKDALAHGANAVEIDMTAWRGGWWADHDGTLTSAGDKAEKMFQAIRDERQAGKTLSFVWLDIKNPDYCNPDQSKWRHCSIDALRDLARQYLHPQGIRVLYGFSNAKSKAFSRIRNGLNLNEAVNVNGETTEVRDAFAGGPSDRNKRVMSYGYYNLKFQFGNCQERNYYTCTELRQGAESNLFGKTFGWTSAAGQAWYVDQLLTNTNIDGLIYGFKATYYYDHKDTRAAFQDIKSWLANHPDRRFLASQDDRPW